MKMFKIKKNFSLLTIVVTALLLFTLGCDKDDSSGRSTSYDLKVKDVLGVSGTVTFTETSNTQTTVDIMLLNSTGGSHPANLYMKSAVENGTVAAILNPVDASGKSSTVINMAYNDLIVYDGNVRVLKSNDEPNIVLAAGDIGGNILTNSKKSYTLKSVGGFGVSGTALFEKRENGNTLVTLSLVGTLPAEVYPATINLGSLESIGGGPVTKTLTEVTGSTGKSYTNISKLNNGTNITYENWLAYDGYIVVYQSLVNSGNIIASGNIGSN